jgi:multiple sugar transport system substrate-binding protein
MQDMERIRKALGDRLGITSIPVPDTYAGKPVFGISGWSVGISRQNPHKDEAWSFISFLAERNAILAGRAVPGIGIRSNGSFNDDTLYAKAWDMYEAGEGIQEFAGKPGVRELEAIVREELEALFETSLPAPAGSQATGGAAGTGPGSVRNAAAAASAIQNRWEAAMLQ